MGFTNKSERKVTFFPQVLCQTTRHINDYTESQRRATWYSEEEFRTSQHEIKQTMRMIKMNLDFDDGERYCQRGLEHRSHAAKEERILQRESAKFLVLNWQKSKKQDGLACDWDELAAVYEEQCFGSIMTAYATGVADERYAKSIEASERIKTIAQKTTEKREMSRSKGRLKVASKRWALLRAFA